MDGSPVKKRYRCDNEEAVIVISDDSNDAVATDISLTSAKLARRMKEEPEHCFVQAVGSVSDTSSPVKRCDNEESVIVISDDSNEIATDIPLVFAKQAKWMKQEPEYYCADPDLPIFERIHASRKRLYSVQDVAQILLSPSLLSSKFVCSKIPTSICENVSFIIHLDRLEDKKDVLSDDMGSWKNNGVDTTHIRVNSFSDSEVESVEKCDADDDNGVPTYSIKRVYRTHTTDGSLKKLTAYIYDSENQLTPLALVTYKFDGVAAHEVSVRPHGNAKCNKPYRRTRQSTKNLLKGELDVTNPKEAVDNVFLKKGGMLEAQSAGELPRGRMQAYNIKRTVQNQQLSLGTKGTSSTGTRDMLYVVMEQCKSAEKVDVFVQDVTCAPEPMAVLCTEHQLSDIARFCCDPFHFSILGIDPTFNLGEFSVTPTVYRHLLLQDPSTGQSPLLLGPILVHQRKQFRNYNYFFSTLNGLNQEIAAVKAIGTDGEKALAEAAIRNFPQASHVRCFRHLQQNIEQHLREEQFPPAAIKLLVGDIFGHTYSDGTYNEGLVDSCNIETFDAQLQQLKVKWDHQEKQAFSDRKSHDPAFHTWFSRYKAEDFRNGTLRSLREEIGLGCPPRAFYTNDSESINALLKQSLGYKKHQWGVFNNKVKHLVEQQQREVEKAVIGYGVSQLKQQYSFLSVPEEKWFRMSQEQRQQHLRKFNKCSVRGKHATTTSVSTSSQPSCSHSSVTTVCQSPPAGSSSMNTLQDITTGRFDAENQKSLTVDLNDAVQSVKVPYTTMEGIWKKAGMLVKETNAVVPAPGFNEGEKMVKSKSGAVPHMVSINHETIQYKCDDKCSQYKSANICSHTVAAAEVNGDLVKFLHFLRRNCATPNLMQLASHGMPAGVGRKGGKAAKKKVPRKRAPTEENRVPLATCPPSLPSTSGHDSSTHSGIYGSQFHSPSDVPSSPYGPPQPYYGGYGSPYGYESAGHSQSPYPFIPPYDYQSSSWAWPTAPPPWSLPSTSNSSTPETFKVHLKNGKISVCSGCRNGFTPLDTIVLQHTEFRQFTSPRSGLPSSRYGNAYYHAKKRCIQLKWGQNFTVSVPEYLALESQQKAQLSEEFGV